MPKMKTHKATAKRIKVTGKRGLRRMKHKQSHFKRRKSKRVLREIRGDMPVSKADQKRIRRLLGVRPRK